MLYTPSNRRSGASDILDFTVELLERLYTMPGRLQ